LTASAKGVGAITVFVDDPKRSKAFYEKVLGARPIFEDDVSAAFQLENLLVNLLKVQEADELIEPARVGTGDGGSRFMLTIWVDDADAASAALADQGIELLNGPIDRGWGVRTAAFADPDGHVWELAQRLG
jgi:catechol 2,3-dioxygenase-like lactoylglutathione lyase family enzyme